MRPLIRWTPALAIFIACAGSPATSLAQIPIKEKQVPQEIRDDFSLRFSDAEAITWLKDGDKYYGAKFQVRGKDVEAIYAANDGQWIQTQEEILYISMPDSARAYCRGHYPEYTASSAQKLSTRKYGILYELHITGERKQIGMTFDMHGRLLKEQAQEPEQQEQPAQQPASISDKFKGILKKD